MKHLGIVLFSLCCLISGCGQKADDSEICGKDKIYFFYQTACSHCHEAAKYIKNKYPNLTMVTLDVRQGNNLALLQKAAQKYNLNEQVGTPLICFGDNHIMGWDEQNKRLFDMFVKPFINNQEKSNN